MRFVTTTPEQFRGVVMLNKNQGADISKQFCNYCGTGLYGTHKAGPLEGQPGINVRRLSQPIYHAHLMPVSKVFD